MDDLSMLVAFLERRVADLERRLGTPFALTQSLRPPDDTGAVQTVQMQLDPLSTRDNVPVLYNYGVTGVPPLGANFHVAFIDGDRSKAVAIASGHQTYRLRGLGEGESAIYDNRGAFFWLTANDPSIQGAGKPTLITGDLHVTGEVFGKFGTGASVSLTGHEHGTGTPAAGTVPPTGGT